MTLPIDHFNVSDCRTFENRYWMNATFYEPGGPVFWFDSGEQNAQPLVPYFLDEVAGPSAVMTLARRFNGIALLVEHRYYGGAEEGSYPFPTNSTTGELLDPSQYVYLNTEQALEDTVYFAGHFQAEGIESSLLPEDTPWIWLGGSYPGIRGAQLRVRNPKTFYATWASSAPTEAAVDMWTYFAQAERSMTRNCSADFTAITRWTDGILANGTEDEIKDLKIALWTAIQASPTDRKPAINADYALSLSEVEVANYLQTALNYYQYYGFHGAIAPFCDIMETQNRTSVSTTDNGGTAQAIAPASGLAIEHGITAAWASFLTALIETNYDELESPTPPDVSQGYSWTYQYCSEYGYYQRGNPDNPHTIESQFISLEYFQQNCNDTFPGLLPASPNVKAPNKYGGWNIQPSNTMFTSGEFDPWRALSPASTEKGSPGRKTTQFIPECNEAPGGTDIFGLVYDDMVHVSDMRALLNTSDFYHQNFSTVGFSSPISVVPFYAGTGLFERALEGWLPCFDESRGRKREL
ncbi:peptidase S28 [Xylariales sp. AK1849]|nr:peptidase S28 [Xylariales sp. AK1849]